ncbi:MAG: MFS transporter [Anaerolineales bacterium]|nr:MFS transporter [Anaerolineales bacterium]
MARIRNPEHFLVKATLLITSALVVLGGATLAPALPAIQEQFKDVPNVEFLVRFVLTLPALLIAISAPFAGYVVDKFGRKNILIGSVIITGLAGLSGYVASTLGLILLGRGLLGIGVAGLMISTTTLITDYYSGESRATFMGLQAGFMGLAGTVLIIAVGFLADFNWRSPFLIYVLPFLMLAFIVLALYEPKLEARCPETPAAVGEPGSCVGESMRNTEVATQDLSDAQPAPVKLILFIFMTILLVEIIFYVIPIQLPFYFQELSVATAAQSGLAISTMAFVFAVASMLYGKIAAKMDRISILALAFVLIGIGYASIAMTTELFVLYMGLILAGIGIGLLIPNLYVWLTTETPLPIRARILGGFTTALFLGQFLSPIISQPVTIAFDVRTVFVFAGALALLFVPIVFFGRHRLRSLAVRPMLAEAGD